MQPNGCMSNTDSCARNGSLIVTAAGRGRCWGNFALVTCRWSRLSLVMSFLNLEELPFVGMSYEFVGETQGAPFSAYIVNAKPGQGPPLHTHPYVEVAFVIEGTATFTLGDEYAGQGRRRIDRKAAREAASDRAITSQTHDVKSGGIVVIPANTPHRFVNSGDTILRQIDVHASPRFIQTDLA